MAKKLQREPMFTIVKGGYDIASVENYIEHEHEKAERAGIEQRERIVALKEQLNALKTEMQSYRENEESIKNALISATDKSDKMLLDVKFRYAMELERLRLFRAKWQAAYEEINER